MNENKIVMKLKKEDKEKFQEASRKLCLTLSGFMKLAGAEKLERMEDKENKLIKINISERDKMRIERLARENEMSVSCLCRNALLNGAREVLGEIKNE